MTYLKKPTLSQQQNELQKLIDERLNNEESKVRHHRPIPNGAKLRCAQVIKKADGLGETHLIDEILTR